MQMLDCDTPNLSRVQNYSVAEGAIGAVLFTDIAQTGHYVAVLYCRSSTAMQCRIDISVESDSLAAVVDSIRVPVGAVSIAYSLRKNQLVVAFNSAFEPIAASATAFGFLSDDRVMFLDVPPLVNSAPAFRENIRFMRLLGDYVSDPACLLPISSTCKPIGETRRARQLGAASDDSKCISATVSLYDRTYPLFDISFVVRRMSVLGLGLRELLEFFE